MGANRVGQLARRGTVVGRHDPIRDERAVEREEGAAPARERVVVVAKAVQRRPGAEDDHDDADARCDGREPRPPRHGAYERDESKDDEHLVAGPRQRGRRCREAEECEARHSRLEPGPCEQERPGGEHEGADRVAREHVEEDPVARVEDERDGHDQSRARPEDEGHTRPAQDRGGEEDGHERLRSVPTHEVERAADDERSDRRAVEHRHRKHRVPLEHLNVEAEVRPEVATRDDGQRDALETVDDERDRDDGGASAPGADPSLEPG